MASVLAAVVAEGRLPKKPDVEKEHHSHSYARPPHLTVCQPARRFQDKNKLRRSVALVSLSTDSHVFIQIPT